jgi:hypothetical protein
MKRKINPVAVRHAFEDASLRMPLANILPLRQLTASVLKSKKYAQIAASIEEVGIIEPPVVVRDRSNPEVFLLLDGHIRIDILKKRGDIEVVCLVATDDEAFTYNKRISRMAIIQEHRMILKAIERGVPEERLARALNVSISNIKQKKALLDGICPEAVSLLKDKHVPINTMEQLKKLKPVRQIEAIQLMSAVNKFTVTYARSIVAATPDDQMVNGRKRPIIGLSEEQLQRMQIETESLNRDFRKVEEDFGADHLDLVIATGYVGKLLNNARVVGYLAQHHPDIFSEFQRLTYQQKAA